MNTLSVNTPTLARPDFNALKSELQVMGLKLTKKELTQLLKDFFQAEAGKQAIQQLASAGVNIDQNIHDRIKADSRTPLAFLAEALVHFSLDVSQATVAFGG